MCGICGICEKDISNATPVVDMMSIMTHRGPDDNGVWVGDGCALGHQRLSIIDLSKNGNQPMSNEDGTVWLVVNGEIYNYIELRRELESGHQFRSQTDSEVIVHAYEEWGPSFLKHLNGMFAIALYDTKKRTLLLARDPMGEKPLYFWHDGNKFIFASEIKAILKAGVKPEVDRDALYGYLALQYSVGRQTLFKGIGKILAGGMATIDSNGLLRISRYWDIKQGRVPASDAVEGVMELRSRLAHSTRLRMRADVPVGAFLSGGIDSSAVVALARPFASEFHTFSVGFESFSETPYAETVSRYLKTTHHNLIIRADDVAKDITKIAWHYDEPLGDAAIINNYYLGKVAKDYVKVVLAGEGGDELFGGYRQYQIGLKWHWVYSVPGFIRWLAWLAVPLIENRVDTLEGRLNHLASFFFQPTFEDAHRYMLRVLNDKEIRYYSRLPKCCLFPIPHEAMQDALDEMLATDCKNLLPEKFMMKADKAVMASSVEERLPLLDTKIVDLAFSMPQNMKIRNGVEKWALREAVRGLLPTEIVNRKKQVFNTPVRLWLRNKKLAEMAVDRIENGELIKEHFRTDRLKPIVKKLKEKTVGGNGGVWGRSEVNMVWTLFALQLWHDTYFGGE